MSDLSKNYLLKAIEEHMTDEQLSFIADIVVLFDIEYVNKEHLMMLAKVPLKSGYIDSAYPIDYYRRIEEVYPNIKQGNFIYDYRTEKFGELVNLNDLIVKRIINLRE